jgi:hypothetical protein
VYLTRRALFTADECAAVVAEAEAAAAVNSTGGWSTARHYSVPTTDTPLHALPRACLWFNAALRSTLAPMLAAHFPRTVGDAARVRTAMCESCEAARGGGEMGPGRGTTPKLSRRACRPRHGLRSWRRKSTGVAKQPLDLISHPKSLVVRFATFTSLYAAGGGGVRRCGCTTRSWSSTTQRRSAGCPCTATSLCTRSRWHSTHSTRTPAVAPSSNRSPRRCAPTWGRCVPGGRRRGGDLGGGAMWFQYTKPERGVGAGGELLGRAHASRE